MQGSQEVPGSFVRAGGDAAERLELGTEVLDQIPRLMQDTVIRSQRVTMAPRRNDGLCAARCQRFDHTRIRIVSLVSNQDGRVSLREQPIRALSMLQSKLQQGIKRVPSSPCREQETR